MGEIIPGNSSLVPINNADGARIAMAMAPAAFDSAQRNGNIGIDANLESIAAIAHHIGFIERPDPAALPPLFFVAREGQLSRAVITSWDYRLPEHDRDPVTARYYSVTELTSRKPNTVNRDTLVQLARNLGATAFSEITFDDWEGPHVEAVATAFLLGQRPLDLPPPKHIAWRAARAIVAPLTVDAVRMHRIYSARDHKPPFPPPFIVRRGGSAVAPAAG